MFFVAADIDFLDNIVRLRTVLNLDKRSFHLILRSEILKPQIRNYAPNMIQKRK